MDNTTTHKSFPRLSLYGAIGFVLCLIAISAIEFFHAPGSSVAAQRAHLLSVMICLLLASWSSIVSLITAWCPIVLGGDHRPWYWVVPLVFAWIVFVDVFDWTSLVPHAR